MAAQPPPGGGSSSNKHCQPVHSALSPLVDHPAREPTTTQARPLTSHAAPPSVAPQVAADKKKKKRQAQRDAKELAPEGDEGTRSRIVVPGGASSSSTIAAATPASVTKSARPKKGRKKKRGALPSQASQFSKSKAGPSSSSTSSSRPKPSSSSASSSSSFAPVHGQGSAVAFTRPRGDALNSSIASVLGASTPDSVLGARPADVLEAHDRETRTKRQKVAADEMRRRLLLDMDDDNEDEAGSASAGAAGTGDAAARDDAAPIVAVPPALLDDDDDDLVIAPAAPPMATSAAPAPSVAPVSTAGPSPSATPASDPLASYRSLPSLASRPKAFVFPQPPPPPSEAPGPTFRFSFDLPPVPVPDSPPPAPMLELAVEDEQGVVRPERHSVQDVALEQPASPAAAAPAEDEPMPDVALADPHPDPRDDQPASSAPLPADAVPKPDLRSAAAVLAGKKRKSKKVKRAPQLFDYLSDEQSDDWEDVQALTVPKRPKTGRAVDGKLESGGEAASGEAEVKVDSDEEREKKALAEKLVPTSYQTALLECAKQANVVTVLQTGSGKTLVGVRPPLSSPHPLLRRSSRADAYT